MQYFPENPVSSWRDEILFSPRVRLKMRWWPKRTGPARPTKPSRSGAWTSPCKPASWNAREMISGYPTEAIFVDAKLKFLPWQGRLTIFIKKVDWLDSQIECFKHRMRQLNVSNSESFGKMTSGYPIVFMLNLSLLMKWSKSEKRQCSSCITSFNMLSNKNKKLRQLNCSNKECARNDIWASNKLQAEIDICWCKSENNVTHACSWHVEYFHQQK